MTRYFAGCVAAFVLVASRSLAADPAVDFLRLIFGAEDGKVEETCWPNHDLWMPKGPRNAEGLAEIAELKLKPGRNQIIWETIQNGMCSVEVRDGKADARFVLDHGCPAKRLS